MRGNTLLDAQISRMMLKYADVVPVAEVFEYLENYAPAND